MFSASFFLRRFSGSIVIFFTGPEAVSPPLFKGGVWGRSQSVVSIPVPAPVPAPAPPKPAPVPPSTVAVSAPPEPSHAVPEPVLPEPAPAGDVLPVSVASRFWISGSISKPTDPDFLHLVLTDGVSTFSVRVAAGQCSENGVLFCTVAGYRFNAVPLIQRRSEPVVPKAREQATQDVQIVYN